MQKLIRQAADFLHAVQRQMRKGEATRDPLTMLRFEWKGDTVECDWLMRNTTSEQDPAAELAHSTEQGFRDALALRSLVFASFSAVMQARLRMFRSTPNHRLELLLTGTVNRLNPPYDHIPSLATRAHMMGFEFLLHEGFFAALSAGENSGLAT